MDTFVQGGFTYVSLIGEVGGHGRERWVKLQLSGRSVQAWQPYGQIVKVRRDERYRFFLSSIFIPGDVHLSLHSVQRGFVEDSTAGGFSAKGQVLRVVDDWAVIDCGFYLVCELVPEYFAHEEHQTVRRGWKEGETVLETGMLKIHIQG